MARKTSLTPDTRRHIWQHTEFVPALVFIQRIGSVFSRFNILTAQQFKQKALSKSEIQHLFSASVQMTSFILLTPTWPEQHSQDLSII